MKGERKKRMREKEARENRKGIRLIVETLVLVSLLILGAMSTPRTASPAQMVAAQVVHGNKSATIKAQTFSSKRKAIAGAGVAKYPDYIPVSFADLSSFPFVVTDEMVGQKPDADGESNALQQIPEFIQALSQKKIAVTGFMLPVRLQGKFATEFLILKNRSACCYGMTPRINEWIIAHAKDSNTATVMDVPVTALGTFHVGEQRENGELAAVYELDCDKIINPDK